MTRIFVKVNYGGRITREQRIVPGEYDIDAPELFGAGEYLLENGHAVAVKTEAVPVREATKAVEIQTVSIEPNAPEETGVEVPDSDLVKRKKQGK
jgi:hypothetical protein